MTLKFLNDVKHEVTSPFKKVGNGGKNLVDNIGHSGSKIVNTLHNDAKGITKGMYSMGKDVTGALDQLTSPLGLIVIGGIIVVVLLARK